MPRPLSAQSSSLETPAVVPLYVGLRRSSYGLRKQNGDDPWWFSRAKTFATNFPGAQPLILQIVSNYQDDGSTEIEFKRPESYQGSTTNMTFRRGSKLNHEQALSAYDAQGVKAILQFEPGNADVAACFELAHLAFGQHPCVIGLAIDAEWFRTKESTDQTGLPIPDADAHRWMEQVLRFNPAWLLVLKHFEAKHLPTKYRHPHLWFLTDIATNTPGQSISNYAVIIIGHSELDTNRSYLNLTTQANLSLAVSNGTGLVSFDNDLQSGGSARYQFVQDIFGFSYGSSASGTNASLPPTEPSSQMHFITARHPANDLVPFRSSLSLPGITVPATATTLAMVGGPRWSQSPSAGKAGRCNGAAMTGWFRRCWGRWTGWTTCCGGGSSGRRASHS